MDDARSSLFIMLGQIATKSVKSNENIALFETLEISPTQDLAKLLPSSVKEAISASEAYKLFFVFENYLREFVVEELTRDQAVNWWDKVPVDVRDEVTKLETQEEVKGWMALGSRDKSALLTLPQLLKVIDENWKNTFIEIVRDKALIQEGRMIVHLRNTICHMSAITGEEHERIKQTMRDWFRVVSP